MRGVSVRQTLELLVLAPARVSRVARVRPAPRRARRALAIRLAPGGAPGAVAPRRRVVARLAARRPTGVHVFRVFLVFLFHARVCVRAGGRVVRVIHQKPGAAVHLGEARECVAAAGKQVGEEAVVVARAPGVLGRAAAARDALLREHTHGRALVRARDAVRGVHVAVARHAQVRLVFFFGKRFWKTRERCACRVDRETRRRTADARGGDAAGRAERSARSSRDARRRARVSRKSASCVARVSTVAPRRRRRPTTPTTDARNVDGRGWSSVFPSSWNLGNAAAQRHRDGSGVEMRARARTLSCAQ